MSQDPSITTAETIAQTIANDYRTRASAERAAGGSITLDRSLPFLCITMSDGSEYVYQEWQADEVLDEAKRTMRDCGLDDLLSVEDYLLATFQNA